MSKKITKCSECDFSSAVAKPTIHRGSYALKDGFVCCHHSEKVKADFLFTGKTRPRWCPLKENENSTTRTAAGCVVPFVVKSDFIEYSLQPFIQRLDNGVESLAYEYDENTAEEYCNIKYKNGHKRRVCITADSERAITNDVLKML